jgi:hypothetical protein
MRVFAIRGQRRRFRRDSTLQLRGVDLDHDQFTSTDNRPALCGARATIRGTMLFGTRC